MKIDNLITMGSQYYIRPTLLRNGVYMGLKSIGFVVPEPKLFQVICDGVLNDSEAKLFPSIILKEIGIDKNVVCEVDIINGKMQIYFRRHNKSRDNNNETGIFPPLSLLVEKN